MKFISELAGFSVTRVIPDKCLMGILTGAYEVCGGVIRDKSSGQIVAHLVNAGKSLTMLTPVDAGLETVNTSLLSHS